MALPTPRAWWCDRAAAAPPVRTGHDRHHRRGSLAAGIRGAGGRTAREDAAAAEGEQSREGDEAGEGSKRAEEEEEEEEVRPARARRGRRSRRRAAHRRGHRLRVEGAPVVQV